MSSLSFLFPVSCIAIWAGNGIVSKMAVQLMSPAALAWSRWLVAALVLSPCLGRRAWLLRHRLFRCAPRLALLALLGMVLNQTFGYYAATTLGATEISLIMGLTPLMTVVLSTLLLRERPTWGALLGGLVSLGGLVVLLGQGDPTRLLTHGISIGYVYMLLSALTYALYSVLLRRWVLGLDNWMMLYGQVLMSLMFLTPFFFLVDGRLPGWESLWFVLYAGVPTSALSPWLWMQGISLLGASRTAIYMNLLPVMTAGLAVTLLGEQLSWSHLVGGGLTLAGVILAQVQRTPVLFPGNKTASRGRRGDKSARAACD
ncbi:DMT family transporter [Aeromonas schubertii]|uniref:DMT family transporter n=1 Tax=Aeromonas schubertii TaxID=652 RepID=UPI001CC40521|nr:DMT family transporter [Aeromonas schubertii]MBZ6073635.1 DMT family transporter [Aeromonas schubertii]